eukprot:Pgem_evm1s10265
MITVRSYFLKKEAYDSLEASIFLCSKSENLLNVFFFDWPKKNLTFNWKSPQHFDNLIIV